MNDFFNQILKSINSLALKSLTSNTLGKKIFNSLAEVYIGGHSLQEGLKTIEDFHSKGLFSTFNILGEATTTENEANRHIEAYMKIIDMLDYTFKMEKPASISVEPTVISPVDNEAEKFIYPATHLNSQLEKIVRYASDKNIDVTLDMEDHSWTDLTLDAAQYIWNKGLKLGIVLQSRLHRTKDDIEKLFLGREYEIDKKYIRVRACIGIYNETSTIATKSKKEAKKRLIERIIELFDAGVYVEIATHDRNVINEIINKIIRPRHISSDVFEFQFLKGVSVANNIKDWLLNEGYKVRFYVPTELNQGDGLPYMVFRLIANPGLVLSGAKNTIQLAFKTLVK